MLLKPRANEVNGEHFIYQSSAQSFAQRYGGVVDDVNGDLYIQTSTGICKVYTNNWVITEGNTVTVMTEAEVFNKFVPVDADEACNYLGGRRWPAQMKLAVA